MSFEPVIQAIKDDPSLAEELKAAKTPAERAAILDARGIEKPRPDSEFPEMSDAAGGSATGASTPIAATTVAAATY